MMQHRIHVLFEDDLILAIDKPSGLPSHSLGNSERTREGNTEISCEKKLRAERPGDELHLVHRLDTGTSGVLLFAKSESVFNEMRNQFKLKKIKKSYSAWSEKIPERLKLASSLVLPLRIHAPLAHHPKSKKRMIALPEEKKRIFRGKPIPALTIIHQVLEENFSGLPSIRFDLEIITGVMHQIRVHLHSIGFPLIGDPIYEKLEQRERSIRLALHARKIEFELNGFRYEITSSPLKYDDEKLNPKGMGL